MQVSNNQAPLCLICGFSMEPTHTVTRFNLVWSKPKRIYQQWSCASGHRERYAYTRGNRGRFVIETCHDMPVYEPTFSNRGPKIVGRKPTWSFHSAYFTEAQAKVEVAVMRRNGLLHVRLRDHTTNRYVATAHL